MEDAIWNFSKQFAWEPAVQNAERLERKEILVAAGMGGSALPAELLQAIDPAFDIVVSRDYGFSEIPESVLKQSWVAAISYSGNTEETIAAFNEAIERKIPVAAISIGGKLLELAKEQNIPFIQIPDTGIQPRAALGFTFKALAKMAGRNDIVEEAALLASQLKAEDFEGRGKQLAALLKEKIPVIYASNRNYAVAYAWKVMFNETGKIPAFYNVFPELNHNEMSGFSSAQPTKRLNGNFHFIFLKDETDNPKIQKRMDVLKSLYEGESLPVTIIPLEGASKLQKIFSLVLLANWAAYYTALGYGVDPNQVSKVEEFKRLLA